MLYPDIGDLAPAFTVPSTWGPLSLQEQLCEGMVLLVFYPKDETLVCTKQLCNYRDNLSVFDELGVQIVGINDEPLETHEAFSNKHGFPFPIASDPDRKVCHWYGALGDLFKARRLLVLVGEDGRVWWRHSELRIYHRKAAELQELITELQSHR